MPTETLSEDRATAIVHEIFPGSAVRRHWRLEGGVSATMYAVELEQRDGKHRCVVIRQHRAADWKSLDNNVTPNEFELLQVLFDRGLKVPAPLYLDCSGSILASHYLVTEYIEGTSIVPHDALDSGLQQMAEFLACLHKLNPETMTLPDLPSLEDPAEGALEYLPRVRDDVRLLNAVSSTSVTVKAGRLLHGDFWPGNILWKDGQLTAVLDWEDAALGNPLADLACGRVELLCQYGKDAMDTFTGYYLDKNPLDIADLRLWEIYVSSSALATMANWGLAPDDEKRRRDMTEAFLDQAASEILS